MKKYLKQFILLLSLAVTSSSHARGGLEAALPSIEWQKSKLENTITTRLERRLDTIIPDKRYLIDIDIQTSIPQMPDFRLTPSEPPQPIRYSNATPDQSSGDYIVFNKFGLEVPVVTTLLGEEEKPPEKSEYEFLWKYNQSMDIFQNLEDVSITITLDEELPEEFREIIENVVESIELGLGDIEPFYHFDFMNLTPLPQEVEITEEAAAAQAEQMLEAEESLFEKISRFSNAIGLVLAAFLLGFFGWLLMRKFEKIKKDDQMIMQQSANDEDDKEDDKEDPAQSPLAADSGSGNNDNEYTNGFERFKAYLEKNPEGACHLIKKWIKGGDVKDKRALFGLVKVLDNKTLVTIFAKISNEFRDEWKRIINDQDAYVSELSEVGHYISQQIVEEIIVPASIDDEELREMLIDISNENAALFIKKHPELGGILIELVSSKRIGLIFEHLSEKKIRSTLKHASQLDKANLQEQALELKEKITPFTSKAADNSFIKKLSELIPLTPIGKDSAIYESLKDADAVAAIEELAKNYYPSFLIEHLPESVLLSALNSYPMKKKGELFYILEEETQKNFLNTIALQGETAKQMLKLEIKNIETNESLKHDTDKRKSEIWSQFVTHSRKQISKIYDSNADIKQSLNEWMNTSKSHLKLVEDEDSDQAA